jgi:hypothetical protein
MYPLIVVAL